MAQLDRCESPNMTPAATSPDVVVFIPRTAAEREACLALRYRVYITEMKCPSPTADYARKLDLIAEGRFRVHVGAWIGRDLLLPSGYSTAPALPGSFVEHAGGSPELRSLCLRKFAAYLRRASPSSAVSPSTPVIVAGPPSSACSESPFDC
jgi:hypothetical protein